jgi:hypothetical protein
MRAIPELYSLNIRYGNPVPNQGVRFKEVIHAPLWLIAFVYFLFLSMVLSMWAALGNTPALITFGLLTIWLVYLYFKTALRIQVDQTHFRVGGASIEHKYIGEVIVLSPAEVKLIRTRDADPLAFLAIRFWSSKAIKVEISDPRDRTPYWLITTKKGTELLNALKS